MAELLKNIYNNIFFERFTSAVEELQPNFKGKSFLKQIYADDWENKELKQRMRHITITFQNHLSNDFETNAETILNLIPILIKNGFKPNSLEFIFLPDFIELYGLEHYETSVSAIEKITQFVSCEFAVRPFIIKYEEKMMAQMLSWSKHKSLDVRRLSSEGSRPRLPWAIALPSLKKNSTGILPIIENLKNDTSEYVRRSVANNLNDISKDNPGTVIKIAKQWFGASTERDWIVKHACRGLLKQGNSEIMQLFGFGSIKNIQIANLKIKDSTVKIGDYLNFSFQLKNTHDKAAKIRMEYAVYYQKANGTLSKKVYTISEKMYAENSTTAIERRQSFKIITTRKFHIGKHQLALVINGNELNKLDFELVK